DSINGIIRSPSDEEWKKRKLFSRKAVKVEPVKVDINDEKNILAPGDYAVSRVGVKAANQNSLMKVIMEENDCSEFRQIKVVEPRLHLINIRFQNIPQRAVTFGCFRRILEANRETASKIRSIIESIGYDERDTDVIEQKLSEARHLTEQLRVPGPLGKEITDAFFAVFAKGVFINHSGPAEGLVGYPASGAYHTEINIVDYEEMISAYLRVCASVWNFEAWLGRRAHAIRDFDPHEKDPIKGLLLYPAARIIRSVDCRWSFYIRTREPETRDPDLMRIELIEGLGMPFGSKTGKLNPAVYIYNKKTGEVVCNKKSTRTHKYRLNKSGNAGCVVEEIQGKGTLPPLEVIREIGKVLARAEKSLKHPRVIEGGIETSFDQEDWTIHFFQDIPDSEFGPYPDEEDEALVKARKTLSKAPDLPQDHFYNRDLWFMYVAEHDEIRNKTMLLQWIQRYYSLGEKGKDYAAGIIRLRLGIHKDLVNVLDTLDVEVTADLINRAAFDPLAVENIRNIEDEEPVSGEHAFKMTNNFSISYYLNKTRPEQVQQILARLDPKKLAAVISEIHLFVTCYGLSGFHKIEPERPAYWKNYLQAFVKSLPDNKKEMVIAHLSSQAQLWVLEEAFENITADNALDVGLFMIGVCSDRLPAKTVYKNKNMYDIIVKIKETLNELYGSLNTIRCDALPWHENAPMVVLHALEQQVEQLVNESRDEKKWIQDAVEKVQGMMQVFHDIVQKIGYPKENLLKSHTIDLNSLRAVKQHGWDGLKATTKDILLDPDRAKWDLTFTPKVYYEIYTFFNVLSPTSWGMQFFEDHPELVIPGREGDIRAFTIRIVQNMIVRYMGLSAEDKKTLLSYIYVPGDSKEAGLQKYHKAKLLFAGKEDLHVQDLLLTYLTTMRYMFSRCQSWISERVSRDCSMDSFFGQGDENEFLISLNICDEVDNPEIYFLIYYYYPLVANISRARYHILHNNIEKAINYLKVIIEESEQKKGDFTPLMLLIKQELTYMQASNIAGVEQIVRSLGIHPMLQEVLASTKPVDCLSHESHIERSQ
ncbi:MAG: hypothetical protein GF384_04885, partial [Elusimicrobia bacterium]|nr:hypothetical protein [Elusimicrobiota bacterium]